ncbi:MAG: biopolymer transport protein ExbB/TolQ [Myxococcota bacterium]|jgi:biopolymer transport protein ExbB/TolQ
MLTEGFSHFFEQLGAEWVLWILVVLAVMMLVIIIERTIFFVQRGSDTDALTKAVLDALRKGGPTSARKVVSHVNGMSGDVLRATMDAYDDGVDAVEEVVAASIAKERVKYDRYLSIIGTIGNAAPFIGLFGTVIGILVAFSALGGGGEGGVLKAQVMSSIGEALVATAVGLAVAIPAVVSFNSFKARIRTMAANTEAVTRLVLAHLKASGGADGIRR